MEVDTTRWSGDGELTQAILDRLRAQPGIAHIRVEDAPATREDATYSFISNEVFVRPAVARLRSIVRRLMPALPVAITAAGGPTLADIEALLTADSAIGAPDFSDPGMIQYLRTQRIVPPYQTRGYKLVELVRLYLAAA